MATRLSSLPPVNPSAANMQLALNVFNSGIKNYQKITIIITNQVTESVVCWCWWCFYWNQISNRDYYTNTRVHTHKILREAQKPVWLLILMNKHVRIALVEISEDCGWPCFDFLLKLKMIGGDGVDQSQQRASLSTVVSYPQDHRVDPLNLLVCCIEWLGLPPLLIDLNDSIKWYYWKRCMMIVSDWPIRLSYKCA